MAGIIVLLVLVGFISLLVKSLTVAEKNPTRRSSSGGKVAVINVTGTLVTGEESTGLFSTYCGSDSITRQLREAASNPQVKAVLLRINSPGGTSAAAQEIATEIDRLRAGGKKVVASMGDTAASGAYWIAARTDYIVANPGTLTGSIGVIVQTQQLVGLYDKLGISTRTFKSGPYKDMGSPNRPVTPEEEAIFQAMVDDIYQQFVASVAEGRKMPLEKVQALADGRVFTGRQALELNLVDELGNYYDALRRAGELAGLGPEPEVIEMRHPSLWRQLLSY